MKLDQGSKGGGHDYATEWFASRAFFGAGFGFDEAELGLRDPAVAVRIKVEERDSGRW